MTRNKSFYLYWLSLIAIVSGLLAACSDEKAPPPNLEVITASPVSPASVATTGAATGVSNAATTQPGVTTQAVTSPTTTAAQTSSTTQTAPTTTAASTSVAAATTKNTVTTGAAATTVAQSAPVKPAVALPPVKKGVLLSPMSWEAQSWNNCAPMSALMALSYYGVKLTQTECGKALRPNQGDANNPSGDKHVRPEELTAFIQSKGFKTLERENGTMDQLRALLSAGVPVITQQWLHDNDDIGHYRVARGYDTATNVIIFNDSMDRKPETVVDVAFQDKLWKGYDRRFFPVYTQAQEATVMAILGEDGSDTTNMSRAVDAAKKYSQSQPNDIDAWRNLGYLYYANNDCKSALGVWEDHLTKLLKSSDNGPYNRFLWYQLWPVECYNKTGNYQQVIKIVPNEIDHAKIYAEARYEYAVALSNVGRKDEAVAQLKKALLDDQNYRPTYDMLSKLGVS